MKLALTAIAVLALAPIPAMGAPTLESFLDLEGIDPDDAAKVMAGEIVRQQLEDASAKEIAGFIMVFIKAPIDELIEKQAIQRSFDTDLDGVELQELSDPSPELFADVGYTADETSELVDLLQAKPGTKFNLSSDEIKRFQALAGKFTPADVKKDPAAQKAVMDEYRAVLLARYQAYLEKGLAGVADYDHGKEPASPRQEITTAFEQNKVLKAKQPAVYDAMLNWPDDAVDGLVSKFYCEKSTVQGRPTLVLSQRLGVSERGNYIITAHRQYYVGQSYNSLSSVAVAFAVEGGTYVTYASRTSTDQLEGSMQAMRHKIGRGRMLDAIEKHWEGIQAEYE